MHIIILFGEYTNDMTMSQCTSQYSFLTVYHITDITHYFTVIAG